MEEVWGLRLGLQILAVVAEDVLWENLFILELVVELDQDVDIVLIVYPRRCQLREIQLWKMRVLQLHEAVWHLLVYEHRLSEWLVKNCCLVLSGLRFVPRGLMVERVRGLFVLVEIEDRLSLLK